MELQDFAVRTFLALLLGAIIGIERQWHHRLAGLQTNALVAVGSALFVLLGLMTIQDESPLRMAAQVVSGIGFIGAGVIMREGMNVRGLNTAATLWCSSAVGCLAGTGLLGEAFIATMTIVGSNVFLYKIARHINRQPKNQIDHDEQ
ncbi:MgtC/SapB family protein [Heliophilum fasciatum]|nr:MgtC/SapB family protein [Heliophilum fasciatum]MCW2276775.1 putative Mg2+ transporter-C (MgtC) family protein [Heliophilum fasciatum]